ncbi:hypothetical protein RRG08_023209 [Elysia crispata]|uniref:PiggyBac transposable element-derived protein domain-containing protein n=1 Tax=Elysia crispata TaxID=231223 RepID=A0AAE1DJS5_9GAST|nr:hypothetical protein RRG08_023209 [Elysia crispata]
MLPDIDADDEQSDVEEAEREDWCKLPPTYPAHPAYLESNRSTSQENQHPGGIKVWCAADPTNGYMMNVDVYMGKSSTPMPNSLGHHVMKIGEKYLIRARQMYCCSNIRLGRKDARRGKDDDQGVAGVDSMEQQKECICPLHQ